MFKEIKLYEQLFKEIKLYEQLFSTELITQVRAALIDETDCNCIVHV